MRPLAYAGVFVLVIAGWVVSLCLHEFGHAYTAWRFGDHDVAVRGYLTLDPRQYVSPVLSLGCRSLFIALGGIGLPGAAVYVRTCVHDARQRTMVSLAGPAANLVLAVLLLTADRPVLRPACIRCCGPAVAFLGFLQMTALLLNLLPIPGLDGYGALEPHLSPETQRALDPVKPYGFVLLFLLFVPPLNQCVLRGRRLASSSCPECPHAGGGSGQATHPVLAALAAERDRLRYMRNCAYIADMGAGHDHASRGADTRSAAWSSPRRVLGGFFVVELTTALLIGSIALLADAGHMLTDVVGDVHGAGAP